MAATSGSARADAGEHRAWLVALPAIAREGDWLLLHADTDAYLRYGRSVETVNAGIASALARVCRTSSTRRSRSSATGSGSAIRLVVDTLLDVLGGSRIVHGHTPSRPCSGATRGRSRDPLVSDDGRVVNVDHCLFGGGPGFVTRLDEIAAVGVSPARTA